MTPDAIGPLSRPFPVSRIGSGGADATVEATEAERSAVAADLDLPALRDLRASYRLTSLPDRIRIEGRIRADLDQACVVSLDPFPVRLDEEVVVELAFPGQGPSAAEVELTLDRDLPDELTGDHVDLGAITAEFLALGLDPYPRKPGATFEPEPEPAGPSPFAKLEGWRGRDGSS